MGSDDGFVLGDGTIPSLGIDLGEVYPAIWTDSKARPPCRLNFPKIGMSVSPAYSMTLRDGNAAPVSRVNK